MKGGPLLGRMLLFAVLVALTACGYRFPGGGGFPGGIQSVYLEVDPEDSPLAQALEETLSRDRNVELVASPAAADAVLQVQGGEISSSSAAIGESGVATEYEVAVRADYRLIRDRAAGDGGAREPAEEAAGEQDREAAAAPETEGAADGAPARGPVVIRKREGLEVTSTYPFDAGSNPAAEEANKRRAGRQAAEELADRILESIKTGF
ncbi:LPS assembly lipoprotein LptE [Thiohalorhabdus methylotrophus]|uniref:LPS assembly lipoprotein LptE n=1 Tax=Thiohalorhabdus methylotrophus TaxID=3242694 RepID=A0ABV4TW69_9GAMM